MAFHLGQEVGDGVFITGEGEALQKKKKKNDGIKDLTVTKQNNGC